jgi:hypothetical protein
VRHSAPIADRWFLQCASYQRDLAHVKPLCAGPPTRDTQGMNDEMRKRIYDALLFTRIVAFIAWLLELGITFIFRPLHPAIYVVTFGVSLATILGLLLLDRQGRSSTSPATPHCPKCGQTVDPESLTCASCGLKVRPDGSWTSPDFFPVLFRIVATYFVGGLVGVLVYDSTQHLWLSILLALVSATIAANIVGMLEKSVWKRV